MSGTYKAFFLFQQGSLVLLAKQALQGHRVFRDHLEVLAYKGPEETLVLLDSLAFRVHQVILVLLVNVVHKDFKDHQVQ